MATNFFQQEVRPMTSILRAGSVLAVLALAMASRTTAGEKPDISKPGPEHKMLSTLAGTYEAKVKIYFDPNQPANESTGTMKRKMIMGGRFLEELYNGEIMGQPFYGMGLMGYDAMKKKYTSVWIDSMTTSMMQSQGTYDAATKTLTSTGEDIDPTTGKMMKSRDVFRVISPTEQVMDMYREKGDGKEFKMLEIRYTRK
jgi:hypothetical protein